jgi:hypothetical protein
MSNQIQPQRGPWLSASLKYVYAYSMREYLASVLQKAPQSAASVTISFPKREDRVGGNIEMSRAQLASEVEGLSALVGSLEKEVLVLAKSPNSEELIAPSAVRDDLGKVAHAPDVLAATFSLWNVLARGLVYSNPASALLFERARTVDGNALEALAGSPALVG